MADQSFRIGLFDDAITHFNCDGFSTVKTRGFNADLFPWEKPADRQRFESSLCKPFLFPVNRDAKLGGLVVKRSERCNKICIWKQPAINA